MMTDAQVVAAGEMRLTFMQQIKKLKTEYGIPVSREREYAIKALEEGVMWLDRERVLAHGQETSANPH